MTRHRALFRSLVHCFAAALVSLSFLVSALGAQTEPPPELDGGTIEEPLPEDETKPFDPTQPSSAWNDPGTDGVGVVTDEELFSLFAATPVLPLDGQYLDGAEVPDDTPEVANTPFALGDRCSTSGFPLPVKPLKVYTPNPRYFVFQGGPPLVLVGASADAGCAHKATAENANVCNFGNYAAQFAEAKALGLNKVQVWVALLSDLAPENQPFPLVPAAGTTPAYWQLDAPKLAYFAKLFAVVGEAKRLGLFVEVVFLIAGGELDHNQSRFRQGPWGGGGRSAGVPVKFDRREDFLKASASFKPQLFAAQKAVIQWTVDELWCFDNVFYQIANEPEGKAGITEVESVPWHRAMVAQVLAAEQKYKTDGRLAGGHLIGVQPFLKNTAMALLSQEPNIAVFNGHYTTPRQDDPARIDLGALDLVRTNPTAARIFGFNEGKITTISGGAGTEMHQNGVLNWGTAEPARAEAWEFFFHQGAHFDHFGYRPVSSQGVIDARAIAVRTQLGKLRAFLQGLPLGKLRPSANPPSWVNLPPYPRDEVSAAAENWEAATLSRKYTAALETTAAATAASGRVYLAYFHHSVPRCHGDSVDYIAPWTSGCGGGLTPLNRLVFQGYDARIKANGYQERVTLKLGAVAGTFLVEWRDPATNTVKSSSTIRFTPSSAGGTCTGSLEGTRCVLLSPMYNYDLVLKVTQQ
jgi:hypothetical protein